MAFSFSYSAPMVLPDQEAAELEMLSEEERRAIHADIRPSCDEESDSGYPDEIPESDVEMVREALREMDASQNQAYLEANERVPDLLATESDPRAYIRSQKGNISAAAERIAAYWRLRKRLFGEKAFEPMTLQGAISSDVETLREGYFMLMPPDRYGRMTTYTDRSKVKKGCNLQAIVSNEELHVFRLVVSEFKKL